MFDLTPEQLAAARSKAPRVLVDAGAGSGKTATLAARALHLLSVGVDPESILVLTFTRSACAEIRERIDTHGVRVETFHGFEWGCLGRPPLATWHEDEAARDSLYHGNTRRRKDREMPGREALDAAISRYEAGENVGEQHLRFVLLVLSRLRDAGLVPLWDLAPRANVLGNGPGNIEHVLADEWQDSTRNEETLARRFAAIGTLFVVGDPRQAIFGWRGGAWRNLPNAERHSLSRSFRFGSAIASYANRIGDRFGASPIMGGPQADDDVRRIPRCDLRRAVEGDPSSTLVLARTNRECHALALELGANIAKHPKRNPRMDPLASDADLFSDVWTSGRAVISTVHAAKGREADRVIYVRDMDAERENEEEHRIDYVAITRARKLLVIVNPDTERTTNQEA